MAVPKQIPQVIRFGAFHVDVEAGELRKNGVRLKIQEQSFQVLLALLQRHSHLVTREDLRKQLWPTDTFVDFDNGLNKAVARLRELLGDSADNPRYIETLARKGYRFICPLEAAEIVPAKFPRNLPAGVLLPVPKLRWLGLAAAVIAAFIAMGTYLWRHRPAKNVGPASARIMLAVLPFENLTGDPRQDYFSDGLTEEMITQLGGMAPDRLGVIARTSAMHYKGTTQRAAEIGRELNVNYLLEGSIRREGSRVRISAQLIRARDETHLWAQDYDRDLRQYLGLEDEIARDIAEQIELKLEARASVSPRHMLDPEPTKLT